MIDLMTIATSIGSSSMVALCTSAIVWYKFGRIEQTLEDLPCRSNGFRYHSNTDVACPIPHSNGTVPRGAHTKSGIYKGYTNSNVGR